MSRHVRSRGLAGAALAFALTLFGAAPTLAQQITLDTSAAGRQQVIDGFGTCLSGTEGRDAWFQQLYFDELAASLLRFDLTPSFKSPYSDHHYNSPWYSNDPPFPGPDGNNVRTYTDAASYTKSWDGRQAKIAVMGPNIDDNVKLFDWEATKTAGVLAAVGLAKKQQLGDFKLFASMWSPSPWLKLSSGNTISGQSGNLPKNGTAWPFIWGGNFAGGVLDTSGTPRAELDDKALGGTGPTSALTQYARTLAAYLRGFQDTYKVKVYAISLQNEINFEEFYNSCSYPLASQYLAVLKAARAELDKYPDLKTIKIEGPEDLLGGDGWALWQYGSGADVTHKNLQYLQAVAADPAAAAALDFFSIHGYAPDGVSSAGADPKSWDWWANGWSSAPAAGLPAKVDGFLHYGKRSWMTETSGEAKEWLSPASGFPGGGAFSIALKIHQALTTGHQSGWIYWQLSDGKAVSGQTLTDATLKGASPKVAAVEHFFRYVRPGAQAVKAQVAASTFIQASAFVHDSNGTLTVVLINTSASLLTATLTVPAAPAGLSSFDTVTSSKDSYLKAGTVTAQAGKLAVPVPGYGVVTLQGKGTPVAGPDSGASDGGAASDSGAGREASSGVNPGGGGGGGGGGSGSSGGCSCGVAGSDDAASFAGTLLLGLALLARRRRRA